VRAQRASDAREDPAVPVRCPEICRLNSAQSSRSRQQSLARGQQDCGPRSKLGEHDVKRFLWSVTTIDAGRRAASPRCSVCQRRCSGRRYSLAPQVPLERLLRQPSGRDSRGPNAQVLWAKLTHDAASLLKADPPRRRRNHNDGDQVRTLLVDQAITPSKRAGVIHWPRWISRCLQSYIR